MLPVMLMIVTNSQSLLQYYREAHLDLVRKLTCSQRRPKVEAFTESTNLSRPLNKKVSSKPERDEGEISSLNQFQTELPRQPKTTFELNVLKGHFDSRHQVEGLEEYQLNPQQPIHLSASIQVVFPYVLHFCAYLTEFLFSGSCEKVEGCGLKTMMQSNAGKNTSKMCAESVEHEMTT